MLLTEAPLNPRRNREKSAEVRNNEKNQEMDLYGGGGGEERWKLSMPLVSFISK